MVALLLAVVICEHASGATDLTSHRWAVQEVLKGECINGADDNHVCAILGEILVGVHGGWMDGGSLGFSHYSVIGVGFFGLYSAIMIFLLLHAMFGLDWIGGMDGRPSR